MKALKFKKTISSNTDFIPRLQEWMDSVQGQTFLNYAYSFGAAIVILGTLFKLTHFSGANIFLYIGMGTEVIVFVLSAFDRPFRITNMESRVGQGNDIDPEMLKNLHEESLSESFESVRKAYSNHLQNIGKSSATFADMEETASELNKNMKELNSIYVRMIEAVRVK